MSSTTSNVRKYRLPIFERAPAAPCRRTSVARRQARKAANSRGPENAEMAWPGLAIRRRDKSVIDFPMDGAPSKGCSTTTILAQLSIEPDAGAGAVHIITLTDETRSNGLWWSMKPISYARHRSPPDVIRHAVWLYLRFTLSYRDVEDLLAERGLEVSNESIRRWVLKFGPAIARNLRSIRPRPVPTVNSILLAHSGELGDPRLHGGAV